MTWRYRSIPQARSCKTADVLAMPLPTPLILPAAPGSVGAPNPHPWEVEGAPIVRHPGISAVKSTQPRRVHTKLTGLRAGGGLSMSPARVRVASSLFENVPRAEFLARCGKMTDTDNWSTPCLGRRVDDLRSPRERGRPCCVPQGRLGKQQGAVRRQEQRRAWTPRLLCGPCRTEWARQGRSVE